MISDFRFWLQRTCRRRVARLLLGPLGLMLGNGIAAAPAIQQSPQSVTVTVGTSANFTVGATGTGTLHYDWRRDGTSLGAADSANFSTAATTLADSGAAFSVVVTDSTGSTPSTAAFLTVNPASPSAFAHWAAGVADPAQRGALATPLGDGVPNLLKYALGLAPDQPASPEALPILAPISGGNCFRFHLACAATGITAVVEQSPTLAAGSWTTVAATKTADDGLAETWEAPVSTAGGRAFYRLNVTTNSGTAPVISTQPLGVSVSVGGAPTFTVAATGTGPFTYQWRKNGALIGGATGPSYTAPVAAAGDNGARFTVLVTGPAGTVASGEALLTVSTAAKVTTYTARKGIPATDGGPCGIWYNAEPCIVQDRVGGDLVGLFPGNTKLMAVVSQDKGRTWKVVSPNPSFWLPSGGALCQSDDGKVHILYNAYGAAGLAYARFTLVRDGNGHVTNFTSDLPLQAGYNAPALMVADANGVADIRRGIVAGTDQAGNPRLFWVIYDNPDNGSVCGRIIAGMSTVAAGWAPTSSADWVSLSDTAGVTTLASLYDAPGYSSPHNSTVHLAQHPVSKDIWFEWGPIDTWDGTVGNHFPVQRRRAAPSGPRTWAIGPTVTVETYSNSLSYECFSGAVVATANYVWLQRCSPTLGIVIDRIDKDGTVTANAIPSPLTGARLGPVTTFTVNRAETDAWFGCWLCPDSWSQQNAFFAMHWDGASWTRFNDANLDDAWGLGQSGAWDSGLVVITPDPSTYQISLATIRTE